MRSFKFKPNSPLIIGIFIILLYPPPSFHFIHSAKIKMTEKPVLMKNNVKYGHQWIEFPNTQLSNLIIAETRLDCTDIRGIMSGIRKDDSIAVNYTRKFLFGLFGDRTIISLKHQNHEYIKDDCMKAEYNKIYLICLSLILIGLGISIYPNIIKPKLPLS